MALAAACGVSSGADGTGTPDGGASDVAAAGASGDAAVEAADAGSVDASDEGNDAEASVEMLVRAKLIKPGIAITHDGAVAHWGVDPLRASWPGPTPAGPFIDAAGGPWHTCAVLTTGGLRCWGDIPSYVKIPTGYFRQIAYGGGIGERYCAIRGDQTVACWGDGVDDGGAAAPPPGTFLQVSVGSQHSCGIRIDGTIACWGLGQPGQVCPPPFTCHGQAAPPEGAFIQIASDSDASCAVRLNGTMACWGDYAGDVPAGLFIDVSLGELSSCGIRIDGSIACWAALSNLDKYLAPAPPGPFVQVVTNGPAACALRADDTLVCWGDDTYGYVTQAPASL